MWFSKAYNKLPDVADLEHYQGKSPLTIYSSDGTVIGQYGDHIQEVRDATEFPQHVKNAVLTQSNLKFHKQGWTDYINQPEAITRKVARQIYSRELKRSKNPQLSEIMLAHKMEKALSKNGILGLYLNNVPMGGKIYGFGAAAKHYFNKEMKDLTLAQASILAAVAQDNAKFNPLENPTAARKQQEIILQEMQDAKMITAAQRQAALNEELIYQRYRIQVNQDALYVAEMARQYVHEKYGEEAYTQGFNVYTTVSSAHQKVATAALRKALRNFGRGVYRGAENQLDLSKAKDVENEVEKYLSNTYAVEGMYPAMITQIDRQFIEVQKQGKEKIKLARTQVVNAAIENKKMGDRALKVGSVIRIARNDHTWYVTQQPEIQGALVSMDAETGAIRAVVGGYDFHSKAFNRATEAKRETGDVFTPFIYSAALSKGLKPDTLVNDAPFIYHGWSPKNTDGYYAGMIPLQQALIKSKNVVAVRLTHAMGVSYAYRYVLRFGFKPEQIPQELKMGLGEDVKATPLQMAEAYAAFANGGYKVEGYVVDKIYDNKGNLRAEMKPLVTRQNAQQILDRTNATTMNAMLQDVVRNGTATRVNTLERSDLAGKTGSSNDAKDVWFVGYNPKIVTAVYMGYDEPRSMGRVFGGALALPVWMDYMRFALKGEDVTSYNSPTRNGERPLLSSPRPKPAMSERELQPMRNENGERPLQPTNKYTRNENGERQLKPVERQLNNDDVKNLF